MAPEPSNTLQSVQGDDLAAHHRDQIRSEGSLLRLENLADTLLQSLPNPLLVLDAEHHIVLWNRAFEEFAPVPPELFQGRTPFAMLHEQDRELAAACLRDAFELGEAEFEIRAISKERIGHYIIRARRTVIDQVPYAVLTGLDVTDKRRIEQRLHLALMGADLGTWDYDVTHRQFIADERVTSMLGYAPNELSTDVSQWQAFTHPDDTSRVMETLAAHFAGKTPSYEIEHRMRHKAGHYVWVLSSGCVTERDSEGRPLRACGTHLNITARKQAEKEREALQTQLAQAQKMESVGRLAGGVAHDFNNLLTAILGYAELELAHAEDLDPSVVESFRQIYDAGERARDLTRQLLAFGRKQTLDVKVLNVNALIRNFEKMLNRLIGEDVRVRTILDDSIGSIRADATQIEQVLLNLAVNARDAMQDGGSLTIETSEIVVERGYLATHSEVTPGTYVVLCVSDTGSGMDSATQKMVFEPFFTTKGPGKGTGLGLATVYGIIKQHEGHIHLYSEPGQGTTFKLYLPRTTIDDNPAAPPSVRGPVRGSGRILVVEDDSAVRRLTTSVLASLGYEALEAASGPDAVALAIARDDIDLLVTDVIMPEMSGRQVYERIHAIRPNLRVLYVSGYTANIIAQHGMLEQGVQLLQKPFTVHTLAQKVHDVLSSA